MSEFNIFDFIDAPISEIAKKKAEYRSVKSTGCTFEQFLVAPDYWRARAKAEKGAET